MGPPPPTIISPLQGRWGIEVIHLHRALYLLRKTKENVPNFGGSKDKKLKKPEKLKKLKKATGAFAPAAFTLSSYFSHQPSAFRHLTSYFSSY